MKKPNRPSVAFVCLEPRPVPSADTLIFILHYAEIWDIFSNFVGRCAPTLSETEPKGRRRKGTWKGGMTKIE